MSQQGLIQEGAQQQTRLDGYYQRIDGIERVSGRAMYAGDWKVPGMLYGRTLRSTIAHGVVRKIDIARAQSLEGVRAIITCKDVHNVWSAGERWHDRPVLADKVRYVGDCVAAVAATSRKIAQEALDAIQVEYEELPAVFSIEAAKMEGAPKIWEDGNVKGPITYGYGNIEASFRRSNLTPEATYSVPRVYKGQLEPATSLAWWEGDKLTLVAATQNIFGCRMGIAKDLGLPVENVRVITYYKGGGFGAMYASMNYDAISAILAKRASDPVMVEYSREDDFLGTHTRWPSIVHLRGAIEKSSGKLIGVELKANCDFGAYVRRKRGNFVEGPEHYYSCEAWSGEVFGIYTNTPPIGSVRAPSGPDTCFASETFVDEIAFSLGINPLDFRIKNAIVKYHNERPFVSNGLKECLISGSELIEWRKRWRPPPRSPSSKDKMLSGIGVAMASWHANSGPSEAIVKMGRDGILQVNAGVVDIGTGAKTTMAVIAASVLGLPLEKVKIIWGDTGISPYSIGEGGSRTTDATGTAVKEAAEHLREKILQMASVQFKTPTSNLTTSNGYVLAQDGRRKELEEIIENAGLESVEDKVKTEERSKDIARRAFVAQFAEVEVDAETGQVTVKRFVSAHDSGQIVNRLTAESQVRGAVIMGLGQALSERVIIDQHFGSVQNASFVGYRMPNHIGTPKIDVIFAEVNDPYGPKSLGEVGIVPVPAVIGNAIFNATGKRLRTLPFMPEDLLNALNA